MGGVGALLLRDALRVQVYVAAPPGCHLELARLCAGAGMPTLIEKPLARNLTESREIVELFEAAGVPLLVAYYRRGQPKFQRAKEVVAAGELGDITSVSYSMVRPPFVMPDGATELPWRFRAAESGGGLLMDVGCHTIDIIDYIVGPLTGARGVATTSARTPYDVEDGVSLSATFQAPSGAVGIATMQWSFAGPPGSNDEQIVIRGTRGSMSFSTFGTDGLRITKAARGGDGDATAGAGDWVAGGATAKKMTTVDEPFDPPAHAHQPLVRLIVDELLGGAPSPSRGDNALRVAAVMDATLSAYYGGRADAFWRRPLTWPGLSHARARLATDGVGGGSDTGAASAGAGAGAGADAGAGAGAGGSLETASTSKVLLMVGCYTQKLGHVPDGRGEGLVCVSFDAADGTFAVVEGAEAAFPVGTNPTWLCLSSDHQTLFVINEQAEGLLKSYAITWPAPGRKYGLRLLSSQPTGDGPAHCELHPSERAIAVANYGGGSAVAHGVGADGTLAPGARIHAHSAADAPGGFPGPNAAEQEAPHAHQVRYRDGCLFVPDKGCDAVVRYVAGDAGASLAPCEDGRGVCPAGTGPRHMDWHPVLPVVYVLGECSSHVCVFEYHAAGAEGGRGSIGRLLQTVVCTPPEFDGWNATAQLLVHPSGRFVFASNRGHNSIASFTVDPGSGLLTPNGHASSGGKTPRHFILSPCGGWIVVGNQDSHSLVSVRIDVSTGCLDAAAGSSFETFSPVCIALGPSI